MINKEAMIDNLLKVADALDHLGMESDADYISSIIEKLAQEAGLESTVEEMVEEGGQKNIVVNMGDDSEQEDVTPDPEEEVFGKEVMKAIFEGLSAELDDHIQDS